MSKPDGVMDRHDINAAIRRKHLTLTKIALDAGLPENACRSGILGGNRKGARAIATALGVPFRTLFPDSYLPPRPDDEEPIPHVRANDSPKVPAATDNVRRVG